MTNRFSDAKLNTARRLFRNMRQDSYEPIRKLLEDIDPEILVLNAKVLLGKKAELRQNLPFDPYINSGYDPSENQMSDALREILNPNGIHGLGSKGLQALLDTAKAEAGPEISKKIDTIEASLKDPSSVWVHREFAIDS